MKHVYSFRLLMTLFVGLLLTSCLRDEELIDTDTKEVDKRLTVDFAQKLNNLYTIDNMTKSSDKEIDFKELAFIISQSLETNLERHIFSEVSKKIDGDYNMLLAKDISIQKSSESNLETTNLKKLIELNFKLDKNPQIKYKNPSEGNWDSYFNKLLDKYPTLQISVPNYNSTFEEKFVSSNSLTNDYPLIAYVINNQEDSIKAFDKDGNNLTLTNEKIPKRPVIVISESERFLAIHKGVELDSRYEYLCPEVRSDIVSHKYNYYKMGDCVVVSEDDDYSESETNLVPHRDYNDGLDMIYKARFNNMSAKRQYESWWAGDAEVRIEIIFASSSSGGNPSFESTSKQIIHGFIETKWWGESFTVDNYVDIPVVLWDKDVYGDKMKYVFYEIDGYDLDVSVEHSHTTEIGGTTYSSEVTVTVDDSDDFMGDFIVDYNTNTAGSGTMFSTGTFKCWINQ